jgi:hypothetical protein
MVTINDFWAAYDAEAAWGGGNAGAEEAATAWTDGSTMTALDPCVDFAIGLTEYSTTRVRYLGAALRPSALVRSVLREGASVSLVQHLATYSLAQALLADYTQGATPTSYGFHFDDGLQERQVYGVTNVDTTLELSAADNVKLITGWQHWKQYNRSLTSNSPVEWNSAQPVDGPDVSITVAAAGGTARDPEAPSARLVTQRDYGTSTAPVLGRLYPRKPVLLTQNWMFEMTYYNDTLAAELDTKLQAATAAKSTDVVISLTFASADVLQITLADMYVDATNTAKPTTGLKAHTLALRDSDDTTVAVALNP